MTIKIWKTDGTLVENFVAHEEAVQCLKYFGNNILVSGSSDQTIKIWDISFPHLIQTLTGHINDVKCLEKIGDNLLASGSLDFKIKLWNMSTGENYLTLTGHQHYVEALKYLDNDLLASNSLDVTVKIWNTKTGSLIKSLNGITTYPYSLEKINGSLLLSGTFPIYVYDYKKLVQTTCTLSGHGNFVYTIKLIDEINNIIVSGSADQSLRFWDVDSCKLNKTILAAHSSYISSIELIDNNTFASVGYDKAIKLWNLTGTLKKTISNAHDHYIYAIVKVDDDLIEGIYVFV